MCPNDAVFRQSISTAVVLNQNDTVPEAWGPPETWAFEFFFTPAYDHGKIAFEGWQEPGEGYDEDGPPLSDDRPRRHGLYLDFDICAGTADEQIKIIDTDDVFNTSLPSEGFPDGADIEDTHIGREGLDGDPSDPDEDARVVFYVRFKTAPQLPEPGFAVRRAIYLATISNVVETCPP